MAAPSGVNWTLTEFAADVFPRVFFPWILEDLLGLSELHEIASTAALRGIDVEEAGFVCDALGLLEVVRHNRNREPGL